MSLQSSFNRACVSGRALIPLGMLLLGGCVSTGAPPERPGAAGAGASATEVPARVQALFDQAAASLAAGDFVEAELRFEQFLLQYPNYPGAYVNLALVYANGSADKAMHAALDSALAIDPDFAPALNQLGLLHRRHGRFLEAEAAYLKAITVSPEYALAHYNLGVLNELYLQRLDAALEHFERYQELAGNDRQVEKWIADLKRRVAADRRAAKLADGQS